MAGRSSTTQMGAGSRNDVAGSVFDQSKKPIIPMGTPANLRKIVNNLLDSNPHLWDSSQVPTLLRLAGLYAQRDALQADLDRDGLTLVTSKGDVVTNPALTAMNRTLGLALTYEKALGICFVARTGKVKEKELKAPPRPGRKPQSSVPNLRLA